VAEGGGLLNRYTVQSRIKGSNPFLSAIPLGAKARRGMTPMLSMGARLVVILSVCAFAHVAVVQTAFAQTGPIERNIKAMPGRDVRVAVYASVRPDCTSGPLPGIRLANAPAHGAVTVKRATLKATNVRQCLAMEVPAFVAFYHAVQGFNGTDDFDLEINVSGGRKRLEHFHVTVSNDPTGGQGV
jgi:hypothetical protein